MLFLTPQCLLPRDFPHLGRTASNLTCDFLLLRFFVTLCANQLEVFMLMNLHKWPHWLEGFFHFISFYFIYLS